MEVRDVYADIYTQVENFWSKHKNGVVIIRGATATGKTKLSLMLADKLDLEIISADSRQIFRQMDIGTDKVSADIRAQLAHHQIDIVNPDERYTAGQWKTDTEQIIRDIHNRGKLALIVGGTGLYIDTIYKNFTMPEVLPDEALRAKLYAQEEQEPGILRKMLYEVDPQEAIKHHPKSLRYIVRALEIYKQSGKTKTESFMQQVPKWPLLMIGLWRDKDDSNKRINARIKEMFAEWLLDEVQGLLDQGYSAELQAMQGIGYKQVVEHLQGKMDLEMCQEQVRRATHHLAKKQRTWFRRYIADSMQGQEGVEFGVWRL